MSYEIEKNVPVDPLFMRRTERFPLDEMEVGDSILVPIEERRTLSSAILRQHKTTEKKFICRKLNADSVRCWRIR